MAVQIDSPGQVQEFLGILQRRKWQIVLPTLLFLSLGIAIGTIIPKKFLVTTQVELREIYLDDESGKDASATAQGIAENAPQQILSPKRITEVLEKLKWPEYLTLNKVQASEFRATVKENTSVSVPRKGKNAGSSFVTIEYRDINKDYAQLFLKELRTAWIEQVVERQRTRYDVEYRKLLERRDELEKDYLDETRSLAELRSVNEISPTQPTPAANQQRVEDPTVTRFEANTERSEELDGLIEAKEASLGLLRNLLAETEPQKPKTRIIEGQSFAIQIEQARSKQRTLEQELDGIRPAHPRFQMIQRELTKIDEEIRELEDQQTSNEVSQEFEPNEDYERYQSQIANLELELGSLTAEQASLRKTLDQNRRDLRRLNEAYREDREYSARIATIEEARKQVEIELVHKKQRRDVVYGASGNPFQVTQEVEEPGTPTEPDPLLIIAFSLVLGLAIGFGSSIALEFSKSCFRNTGDISRVMVAPVLGVIAPITTRAERRRRRVRRFLVGSFSLFMIGSILFVTWAWSNEPEMLGAQLNDSIEEFRILFI
jgi:polysaccharide biosynthesis transport protein